MQLKSKSTTMRNLIFTFFAVILAVGLSSAQDDLTGLTGKKALKKASRAFSAFNLDQTKGGEDLKEAKRIIDFTIKQEDVKMDPKVWVLMGDIYGSFTAYNQGQKVLNPDHEALEPNGGMIAFQAYKKALELSPGDKDAIDGLRNSIGSISNAGLDAYESGDYQSSFNAFRSVLDIHDLLKESGAESPLDAEEEYDNQLYITGLAAMSAGENATAKSFIKKLYDKRYDKPAVYDAMYKLTIDDDVAEAEKILTASREKYPEDLGLLFSEINHYLKLEKVDVLEEKLKIAIEQEPENQSLYSTLGNVYDKLYQSAYREGNFSEAEDYFVSAKEYYEKAINIKPDYTDAIYSIGALYYNKAAIVTEEMNSLANDYSKEGTAKYNKKKEEVEALFSESLPYFKNVEKLDPNDRNTLIALKEIFARENDFNMSNEFKMRLEKIDAGETIEKPYFQ
jgi:tetratricopeptide (TPR) repeat protein